MSKMKEKAVSSKMNGGYVPGSVGMYTRSGEIRTMYAVLCSRLRPACFWQR